MKGLVMSPCSKRHLSGEPYWRSTATPAFPEVKSELIKNCCFIDSQAEGIVHSLTECMSQRACERIYKVSNKMVAKLANVVGDMAIHHMASMRLAASLQPENNSICRMCLGSYQKSGYRGPRGSRGPTRMLLR